MRDAVAAKLEPIHTGGKFRALLGFLLDEHWTNPRIGALTITSEGGMLDTSSGFANEFIGHVSDLERNIRGIAKVAELTPQETKWLLGQISAKSGDWRRRTA